MLKLKGKTLWEMLKQTVEQWTNAKAPRLAAALAYYTIFSTAPLMIIVIAIASLVFGQEAAQGRIVEQIQGLVGQDGAVAIQTMLENSRKPEESILATIIGFVVLIIGATGAFIELQDALNTIWGVQPKPGRGIMGMLRDRLLSFTMIVGVGFLLLVSLVLSAALAAVTDYVSAYFTDTTNVVILNIVNVVLSVIIITAVFMMIFKVLPDVKIAWRDVAVGAGITSILFTGGKYLIGLYLGQSSTASTYGAAGSLAVLFIWVYYSSLILFFGAVFTQVFANRFGSHVTPTKNAIYIGKEICDIEEPMPGVAKEKKNGMPKGGTEKSTPEKESEPESPKKPFRMPSDDKSAKTRSLPGV